MTLKERIQIWTDKEVIIAHLEWFWAGIKLGFIEGVILALNLWIFVLSAAVISFGSAVTLIGFMMIDHHAPVLKSIVFVLGGLFLSIIGSLSMYNLVSDWFSPKTPVADWFANNDKGQS